MEKKSSPSQSQLLNECLLLKICQVVNRQYDRFHYVKIIPFIKKAKLVYLEYLASTKHPFGKINANAVHPKYE